jgi:ribonuclease D
MTAPGPARIVATPEELTALAGRLRAHRDGGPAAPRVAVDLEASGMFTYRARVCTMQIAWDDGASIAIVDTLAVAPAVLAEVLGRDGPLKIVHDVAFDARLLAENGIELGNVHDTAVAAHMLGRAATGLASLLESMLGVHLAKEMQQHDWRQRPLDGACLAYLAADVATLDRLDGALWTEVTEKGIDREVAAETEYRIGSAIAAARTPQRDPPYMRIRGIDRLSERELAGLRAIAELREREAERRDVPVHRVMPSETLVEIARRRPATREDLVRVRGVSASSARALIDDMVRALGGAGESLPEDERAHLQKPRVPTAVHRARRERESRLIAWRRDEATRRGVDPQVVLPGHCLKDAAEGEPAGLDELARVPGIGPFRIERDGEAILRTLRGAGGSP